MPPPTLLRSRRRSDGFARDERERLRRGSPGAQLQAGNSGCYPVVTGRGLSLEATNLTDLARSFGMQTLKRDRSLRSSTLRRAAAGLALAALASLALLATACGGSSGQGVAQADSASGSRSDLNRRFSACMRKNGVPNFPDPDSDGHIRITGGKTANGRKFGLDPNSPQFRRAQQSCRRFQPNGGKPDPQQVANDQQQALKFSQCMRSHGVPKFPDPTFRPDGGSLLTIGRDLNPDSPQFKAAQKACDELLSGGPG
jgi:hypothetical protein